MRRSKVCDVWGRLDKKSFDTVIDYLQFDQEDRIVFPKDGITVVAGLNGGGKSTLLISIYRTLCRFYLPSVFNKQLGCSLSVGVSWAGSTYRCTNVDGGRLEDQVSADLSTKLQYYDENMSRYAFNFFANQENLPELLDQYEESDFSCHVDNLSELIGKSYISITCREIEVDGFFLPFFSVCLSAGSYTTIEMGRGEYSLFYLYWIITRVGKDGLVLLEEPELGVSLKSQANLMNLLADSALKSGISYILTTHSPYALESISLPCVYLCTMDDYGRCGHPTLIPAPEDFRRYLGLASKKEKAVLLEDLIARDLFKEIIKVEKPSLLSLLSLQIADGDGGIKNALKSSKINDGCSPFIGIYDGDLSKEYKGHKVGEKDCPHLFLPGELPMEKEYMNMFEDSDCREDFACHFRISDIDVMLAKSKCSGVDYHDWIGDLAVECGIESREISCFFASRWVDSHSDEAKKFVKSLVELI